jgi:hypothetical protein
VIERHARHALRLVSTSWLEILELASHLLRARELEGAQVKAFLTERRQRMPAPAIDLLPVIRVLEDLLAEPEDQFERATVHMRLALAGVMSWSAVEKYPEATSPSTSMN